MAKASGFISANIHASVSGTVAEIGTYPALNGSPVRCIVIENDFTDDTALLYDTPPEQTKEQIIQAAADAGIVGMGGATFPTHVKLSPREKIDTVLINGAECEPYLTADHRLMMEFSDGVTEGALLIAKAVGAEKVIIGIEGNKPEAVKKMREAAAKHENVSVQVLPKRYPMGSEKQLIYSLTGRVVASCALPSSVGVVVQNVSTANAMYMAVVCSCPVTERITTVVAPGFKTGYNLSLRIGTRITDIMKYLQIEPESVAKVISGGPMMGMAVPDSAAAVTKGSSGILLLDEKSARLPQESPCIRCSRCISVCPMGLMPVMLDSYERSGNIEECDRYRAADCIECGSCTFICPAKRNLMQSIRIAKKTILDKRRAGK